MTQLEFNFDDNTPTFNDWLKETHAEQRKHGEEPYSVSQGVKVYKELVKSNFFNMQSNIWADKNED